MSYIRYLVFITLCAQISQAQVVSSSASNDTSSKLAVSSGDLSKSPSETQSKSGVPKSHKKVFEIGLTENELRFTSGYKRPKPHQMDPNHPETIELINQMEKEVLAIIISQKLYERSPEEQAQRDEATNQLTDLLKQIDVPANGYKPSMLDLNSPDFKPRYYYYSEAQLYHSVKFLYEAMKIRRKLVVNPIGMSDLGEVVDRRVSRLTKLTMEEAIVEIDKMVHKFKGDSTWDFLGNRTNKDSIASKINAKLADPQKIIDFQQWSYNFDQAYKNSLRHKLADVAFLEFENIFDEYQKILRGSETLSKIQFKNLIRLLGHMGFQGERLKYAELAGKKLSCSRPKGRISINLSIVPFEPTCPIED